MTSALSSDERKKSYLKVYLRFRCPKVTLLQGHLPLVKIFWSSIEHKVDESEARVIFSLREVYVKGMKGVFG